MDPYIVTGVPGMTRADKAERIESYLNANGIQTDGVQVRWDDELDAVTVRVMADQDPTALLQSYTPTPTPAEVERNQRIQDGKVVIQNIAAKPRLQRTPEERAILALATVVREME